MRVLLAISSNRARNELTQHLAAKGHTVFTSTARGEGLLAAIEHAKPIHVVLVTQAAMGCEWVRGLRQLRRRAPTILVVVLLRPGAELAWRVAMLAGAFEALAASVSGAVLLEALGRAVNIAAAGSRVLPAPPREEATGGARIARSQAPLAAGGTSHQAQAS